MWCSNLHPEIRITCLHQNTSICPEQINLASFLPLFVLWIIYGLLWSYSYFHFIIYSLMILLLMYCHLWVNRLNLQFFIKLNFYGDLSIAYGFRLLLKGYRKSLEENDVWLPHPRDTTKMSAPKLQQAWAKEINRSYLRWILCFFLTKIYLSTLSVICFAIVMITYANSLDLLYLYRTLFRLLDSSTH